MKAAAIFKAAAKKAVPTKAKDTTPEFVNDTLRKNIELFLGAKKDEKKAKSQTKLAEPKIIKAAEAERVEVCTKAGRYFSSIKATANGDSGASPLTVTISFANKYSKIPTDREEELREVYGEDYDKFFKEATSATLTPIAMEDETFIEKIMEAIGPENFARYFNVEQTIEVSKTYHELRVMDKELAAKHEIATTKGLVKCNKPAIKAG